MKAIFAGTFDPFTSGHRDILVRALKVFGSVTVAVAESTAKSAADISERVRIAKLSTQDLVGVTVVPFSGALTDFAAENGCGVLVRGLRNNADYDYEKELDAVYKSLGDAESVYLMCSPSLMHVSSTVVRELCALGKSIDGYCEKAAAGEIVKVYGKSKNRS